MPSVSRRWIGPRTIRVGSGRDALHEHAVLVVEAHEVDVGGGPVDLEAAPRRRCRIGRRLQPCTVAVAGTIDRARDATEDAPGEPLDRAEDGVRRRGHDHRRIALEPAGGRDRHPDGPGVDRWTGLRGRSTIGAAVGAPDPAPASAALGLPAAVAGPGCRPGVARHAGHRSLLAAIRRSASAMAVEPRSVGRAALGLRRRSRAVRREGIRTAGTDRRQPGREERSMHGVGPLARPVPVLGNPAGRQVGGPERGIADDVAIERQGRLDAPDLGLVEGPAEAVDGGRPIRGMDHQLGDQRVVVRRDPLPRLDRRVDPDAGPGRHDPATHPARRRGELARRVLGGQAHLDRVAGRGGGSLRGRDGRLGQGPAGGEPELLADDVEPGDELGHAVLDLEPRVDLEEPEGAVPVVEELAGRRVAQAGSRGDPNGHRVELAPLRLGQAGRGRLLDQLLVAPLERAVALAEGNDPAGQVAQQLDLDVAGRQDLALEVDRPVAERRRRFSGTGKQRRRQVARPLDPTHPAAPAPGRRLDKERVAHPVGSRDDRGDLVGAVDRRRFERPRDDRHVGCGRGPPGGELVAQRRDGAMVRPDEGHPGGGDGLGERRPFGEEPVARMDRLGPGRQRRPR